MLLDVLPSTCTVFVEVIFEGDAAVPGLDLTAASPETDVDGGVTGEILRRVVMCIDCIAM